MDFLKNPKLQNKQDLEIIIKKCDFLYKDNLAKRDFELLMSGKLDYDTHWGKAKFPYNKAFELHNCKNIAIDFSGSNITMEGLTQTFTINECENITIKNLNIDFLKPPFSIVEIKDFIDNTIYVEVFNSDFTLNGGEPIWAIMDYSPTEDKIGQLWKFRNMTPLEKISDNLFSFSGEFNFPVIVGNYLIIRHIGNYRACFQILKSKNITLDNITIYNNPGMGIVGHYSENIFINNLTVKPKDGYIMSTTTDATHFISCSGVISVTNSYFEGMGDDAINVHSFYLAIAEKIDDYTIKAVNLNENGTQDMVFDGPSKFELIEFSNKNDLKPFFNNIIESVKVDHEKWHAIIKFKDKLPDNMMDCVFTKSQNHAHLIFNNNRVYNIRARAVLFQTRTGVIQNNIFEKCTGTGIHVNVAPDWWESIGCESLIIENNKIIDCGFGDATYEKTSGIVVGTEALNPSLYIHKNITILCNYIKANGNENGIFVSSASNILIKNNVFENCFNNIAVFECSNLSVYNNKSF